MKDMIGRDIEVGQVVVYAKAMSRRYFEQAVVIQSEKDFIKIQYVGVNTNDSNWVTTKKTGEKSKLTVTDKNIIILGTSDSGATGNIDAVCEERRLFKAERKKMEKQLSGAIDRIAKLEEENIELTKEVEKIHCRWNILDL